MTRSPRFYIVLSVVVLAVAITITTATGQSADQRMQTTSFSTSPFGLKGIFEALRQSGFDVRRWRRPYDQLPEKATLIIAGPETWITQKTWRETLQPWVGRGGTLVLASGEGVAYPVSWYGDMQIAEDLRYSGTGTAWSAEATDEDNGDPTATEQGAEALEELQSYAESLSGMTVVRAVAETPITAANAQLTVDPSYGLACDYGAAVPLFADSERTYAWYIPVHLGHIILTATPGWLMNQRISEPGNLDFVLAIVGAYGQGAPILFDERAHEYGVGDRSASDLWRTPAWGVALGHMLVLTFWYGLSHSKRFGPRRLIDDTTPRSTMEYVDAMGNLYRRAGMQRDALRSEWHRFRVELGHRYGIDPQEKPVRLVRRLSAVSPASSFSVESTVRTVGAALRQSRLDDKELVRASRALAELRNEVL